MRDNLPVFLILLPIHFFGDFILQTHWQASNKSRRLDALGLHVANYTLALLGGSLLIFLPMTFVALGDVLAFVALNSAAHFCTDYFTSRWSSRHFGLALQSMRLAEMRAGIGLHENPGHHWHNFFVVIGFDQLLHMVALGVTLGMIFGR